MRHKKQSEDTNILMFTRKLQENEICPYLRYKERKRDITPFRKEGQVIGYLEVCEKNYEK